MRSCSRNLGRHQGADIDLLLEPARVVTKEFVLENKVGRRYINSMVCYGELKECDLRISGPSTPLVTALLLSLVNSQGGKYSHECFPSSLLQDGVSRHPQPPSHLPW